MTHSDLILVRENQAYIQKSGSWLLPHNIYLFAAINLWIFKQIYEIFDIHVMKLLIFIRKISASPIKNDNKEEPP